MDSQAETPNGRSTGNGARTLGQRVDRANDTAHQAWEATRHAVSDLRGTLDVDGRVRRNPYGTMAAALGIGYVLGGGLFSPLTGRIVGFGLRIGLKLAVLPLLKRELSDLAHAFEEGTGQEGAKGRRTANVNKENVP